MTPWSDKPSIPGWGRCPECSSPAVNLGGVLFCAKSSWSVWPKPYGLCGFRMLVVSIPELQMEIRAVRRAYAAALRSLEENRPS